MNLQDKRNFSQCCKQFNGIFGLPDNMDNIVFLVDAESFSSELPLFLSHKYKNVTLRNLSSDHFTDKLLKLNLKTMSENVTELHLTQSTVNFERLCKLFKYFKNIEKVELHNLKIQNVKDFHISKKIMKQLKTIEIDISNDLCDNSNHFSVELIKHFISQGRKDFNSVKFQFLSKKHLINDVRVCIKFLGKQQQLKVLHLIGNIHQFFIESMKLSSQLETLLIENHEGIVKFENYLNLIKLVRTQKKLKKLKIPIYGEFFFPIVRVQLLELFSLPIETLLLNFENFCQKIELSGQENKTVKTLIVKFSHVISMPSDVIENIAKLLQFRFPNVKELSFSDDLKFCNPDSCRGLVTFLNDWKCLKSVDLSNLPTHHYCIYRLVIPELQQFKLFFTMDISSCRTFFCNFLAHHSNIRDLEIHFQSSYLFNDIFNSFTCISFVEKVEKPRSLEICEH